MAYGDPNNPVSGGIGSDVNFPLTGWTTNMPSTTFAPNGGIGGDWRFPSAVADPRTLPAPAPGMGGSRVLRNPVAANPPLPPVNPFRAPAPNLNVPVGQVARSGSGSLWDALRALFSGQPSAQGQGMTGMLQPRGQAGPSTDALGNPFSRFG